MGAKLEKTRITHINGANEKNGVTEKQRNCRPRIEETLRINEKYDPLVASAKRKAYLFPVSRFARGCSWRSSSDKMTRMSQKKWRRIESA
jgi:hypothetical protein